MKRLRIAIHQRRALNCFVSGEYDAAEKHFTAVERIRPDHPGINHNLGLVAMARGDHLAAERRFLADLQRLGDHYPRLRVLADNYYLWGHRTEALDYYRRALEDGPPEGSRGIITERIAICEDDERFERSRASLARYNEGVRNEAAGNPEEAIAAYTEAVALDATNLTAANNAGALLMNRNGDHAAAARLFERGLAMERVEWLAANLEKANQALVEQER